MNLRHLLVFRGIAKAGSVNAAARLLHTSQPAVSRELRTLEERLGVLLFDRLPRGMRLTEAGQVLLDYAERIFGLDEAAERAMRELSDLEGGQLAIGASNTIGTYLLPASVAPYSELCAKATDRACSPRSPIRARRSIRSVIGSCPGLHTETLAI